MAQESMTSGEAIRWLLQHGYDARPHQGMVVVKVESKKKFNEVSKELRSQGFMGALKEE